MFLENKNYKGVTLMELLVVIAIIGIMTGVSIVSLRSSKNDAQLKAAQGEVAAAIRLAQSYALQGKVQGGTTPCFYGLNFTSATSYNIFYISPVSGSCSGVTVNGTKTTMESHNLINGVKASNYSSFPVLTFSIPFGNIAGFGTFTLILGSATKNITVSDTGNVVEN